jgi:methyl-accepting chemotaxis protein
MTSRLTGRHWPLRLKIVLLLFVSSALPLAIVGYIEFSYARGEVLSTTTELLTARGDEVAGKLDTFLKLYRPVGERIAHLPEIIRYVDSPPASRQKSAAATRGILELWQETDANIRGLAILDATGTVILGTEEPLIGRNLAYYKFVQEAIKGTPTVSDLYVSGVETGSTPTIAYLTPIKDGRRQVAGMISIWVRASAVWKVIADGNEKAGEKSFSVLFDHFGVRIAHSYSQDIVFHPGGRLDPATVEAMVAERRFGDSTRQLLEDPKIFPEQFQLALAASVSRDVFRGFAPVNQQWNIGVPRRLETVPWTLFYMIPEKSLDPSIARLITRIALLTAGFVLLATAVGLLVARGIVGSVKLVSEVAETLGICAAELTASVTGMASGLAETATAVSQTTSTVEEVKQTAQVATEKAQHVSESAQQTAKISQNGRRSVQESIEAMQSIREQMQSIIESIVRLSAQGQTIGEIIATVNDLAEQSNLLAVNAAIEAAKAGEQGKGFAVVAQEVKSLAEQSKQATAQVRTILGDIQKATSAAVMATEQGSKAVEVGMKLSGQVGESIRALADSIEEAARAATQIAASAQQQLVGMDQVALAMQNIEQASVQNVASTKQTESAAQNLHDLGQTLKQLAEQYYV